MKVNSFPDYGRLIEYTIFLGGSTAKGNWQPKVAEALKDLPVTLINTSRPDWDIEKPDEDDLCRHIEWEMSEMKGAKAIFIYIPSDAKSPTVLLELGLALASKKEVFIVLEEGYPYYLNAREAILVHDGNWCTNFDDGVSQLRDWLENY